MHEFQAFLLDKNMFQAKAYPKHSISSALLQKNQAYYGIISSFLEKQKCNTVKKP